ncbi:MAG: radical SAM protein [Ruthenibacterium lactatiformans]
MFGLYIHIPYCRSKCRYIEFYTTPCPDGEHEAYIGALCRKWTVFRLAAPRRCAPTRSISAAARLAAGAAQAARLIRAAEPEPGAESRSKPTRDRHAERLAAFRRAGVNRLSLGIQTARDDNLARLGRRHTAAQSRRALGMAVQAGFTDISGDLMLALPAYTMAELDETIALLAESSCTHQRLSAEDRAEHGVRQAPAGSTARRRRGCGFLSCRREKLAALGYAQYEISISPAPALKAATTGSIGTAAIISALAPRRTLHGRQALCHAGGHGRVPCRARGVRTRANAPPKITSCSSSVFPAGFH